MPRKDYMKNWKNLLRSLPRGKIAQLIAQLTDQEAEALLYDWSVWGRENQQIPPGDWNTWMILAGRGYGKSRTGAETVKQLVMDGSAKRIALVGPTASDARDVMVEGESGILSVFPASMRPKYEPSKRRITFHNGAIATTYSADEPDRLRGPQHDFAWCDELAAWRYDDAWDMLQFGLRLGRKPRAIVTTTPRPTKLVKTIARDKTTHITRGSTYENQANLAGSFLTAIRNKYEGTRLGRQELYAEILDDNPGALWQRGLIDELRVKRDAIPHMNRIVVAVDPAVTSEEDSDETGIVVAGLGIDGKGYVLHDGSLKGTPMEWAKAAVDLYHKFGADRIVAEINQGGDMVEAIVRQIDSACSYKGVRATKGKITRAEPVAALYEQKRVAHVGAFQILEDQMTEYDPLTATKSPDRMDALVWAFTELMVVNNGTGLLDFFARESKKAMEENPAMAKRAEELNKIFGRKVNDGQG
jgi:phage terminase large subunit-like protein